MLAPTGALVMTLVLNRNATLKLDPKTKYLDWTATFPEAGPTALATAPAAGFWS